MQIRGTEWKFGLIFLKQHRKEKKRREEKKTKEKMIKRKVVTFTQVYSPL